MEQDKTIVFMDFPTLGEASIVKGVLESNQIPCFLSNVSNPYVLNYGGDQFGGIRLHVFEKDKKRAEELLELIHQSPDVQNDDISDCETPDETNG